MTAVAILTSGGLDSCVLAAELAERDQVHPLYVRAGLAWEEEELAALRSFLEALASVNVSPVTVLDLPVRQVYGAHWSVSGQAAPAAGSPEQSLFLPGRNILLLGLAATWASVRGIQRVAIGTLSANQFPDAQPDFFAAYSQVLGQGLGTPMEVVAPYVGLDKADLLRRHAHLPLERTLTCNAPANGLHCGRCMKCEERRTAFTRAGLPDPTRYLQ